MAIQTKITATANDPVMGSVRITGDTIGERTRSVEVEAFPNPGYEFVGWDIQKYPIALDVAMFIGGFSTNQAGICIGGLTEASDSLYRGDDGLLYQDQYGVNIARDGYWGAGGNSYIVIRSGAVVSTGECSKTDTGNAGGNGGAGGLTTCGKPCGSDLDCIGGTTDCTTCIQGFCGGPPIAAT